MAKAISFPGSRILSLASAITLGLAVLAPVSAHHAAPASAATTASPSRQWIGPTNYQFPGNDNRAHSVSWDQYAFKVDGKHLNIWSGEVHYWRLPSPHQWRDVFQKMKAAGFNAVSLYFFWGYHQSYPGGPFNFSGIRDMDLLLDMAAEEGLYVIARPGPYINAEISMGGMPAWQINRGTKLRSHLDERNWHEQEQWLKAINRILARHQVTNGTGSVLLYQAENEELFSVGSNLEYMRRLVERARKDGITVPTFHNDYAPVHNWAQTTKFTGLDVYSYDDYPIRFDCSAERQTLNDHNWHINSAFKVANNSPHFIAEAQGGAFTPWGASFNASDCDKFVDGNFYRQWAALNNGAGVTAFNYYMVFGGTNWGWTGSAHSGFTSYDYGASLTEDRNLRAKLSVQKENGYFQRAFPQLVMMDQGSNPAVKRRNGAPVRSYQRIAAGMKQYSMSGKGSRFQAYRLKNSNDTTLTRFTTEVHTFDPTGKPVRFTQVPKQGQLVLHGRDALQMPVDFKIGDWGAYYSTSMLFFNQMMSNGATATLTGYHGDSGEIVLHAPRKPRVRSTSKNVTSTWDSTTKQLRINYRYGDPHSIRVTMPGASTLTLRIACRNSVQKAWVPQNLRHGKLTSLQVEGAELVRSVTYRGSTAQLVGSTTKPQDITLWLPKGITTATWNGQALALDARADGSYRASLPGPAPVSVPQLKWVKHEESYESQPGFNDAKWTRATVKRTENLKQGPGFFQGVVLDANRYGFHEGDVWYRAHYVAGKDDPTIWVKAFGAEGSNFLVWVNGKYAGAAPAVSGASEVTSEGDQAEKSVDPTANLVAGSNSASFKAPKGSVRKGQKVVVSILLRNNGQRVDWEGVGNAQHGMGVLDARLGEKGTVDWRIQGARGGERPADTARGLYNNGGLYGERAGWYLPGFSTQGWKPVSTMHASRPGVAWYRSAFTLNVPNNQDLMLRLDVHSRRFDNKRSDHARTVMFVNGWNVGTWVGNVGPQTSFTIPSGFLNPHGRNEIAIAVTAEKTGHGPDTIQLRAVGNWLGSVPTELNKAPTYPQLVKFLLNDYPVVAATVRR